MKKKKRVLTFPDRQCRHCCETFKPKSGSAKFCSLACRKLDLNFRNIQERMLKKIRG